MRHFRLVVTFLLSAVVLSGCGRVKTHKELEAFIKDHGYGAYTVLNRYDEDGVVGITCKDEEYGFMYDVKSKMTDISIDGSKFGESESTGSGFHDAYVGAFWDEKGPQMQEILNEYPGLDLKLPSYGVYNEPEEGMIVCFVRADGDMAEDQCLDVGSRVADLIQDFDGRRYLQGPSPQIMFPDGSRYILSSGELMSYDPEYMKDMMAHCRRVLGLDYDPAFVRKGNTDYETLGSRYGFSPGRTIGVDEPAWWEFEVKDGTRYIVVNVVVEYDDRERFLKEGVMKENEMGLPVFKSLEP